MKKIIFAMGMHRSGTSTLAAGFHYSGLDSGTLLDAHHDNPKGYFENKDIVHLNDRMLFYIGSSWDNPLFIVTNDILSVIIDKFENEAIELIKKEFENNKYAYLKDPRLSILLPFWLHVFKSVFSDCEFVFVHIVRNPIQVYNSLKNRFIKEPIMNKVGEDINTSLFLWLSYNYQGLLNSYNMGANYSFTFETFKQNPVQSILKVLDSENIDCNKEKLKEFEKDFLDDKLIHHTANDTSFLESILISDISISEFYKDIQLLSHDELTVKHFLDKYSKLKNILEAMNFLRKGYSNHIYSYRKLFRQKNMLSSENQTMKKICTTVFDASYKEPFMEEVYTKLSHAGLFSQDYYLNVNNDLIGVKDKLLLHYIKHGIREDRKAVNKTFHNYETLDNVCIHILKAVENKKSFSLVRLGDGEGEILSHNNNTSLETITHYIKAFFGEAKISIEEYKKLLEQIKKASINADILGIPVRIEDIGNYNSCGYKTKATWYSKYPDGKKRYYKVFNILNKFNISSKFTNCHISWELLLNGFFDRLFENVQEVNLISSKKGLDDLVKKTYNLKNVKNYMIPGEASFNKTTSIEELHYPDVYNKLIQQLSVEHNGSVFLVGAGPCGKVYCDIIKKYGGIAIDVGAVFDIWMGEKTRIIVDEYMIDVEKFMLIKIDDSCSVKRNKEYKLGIKRFYKNFLKDYKLKKKIKKIKNSKVFDEEFYITKYPDVKENGIDPLLHYVLYGEKEGREPSEKS